ncbi:hypothetical protein ACWDRX_34840, partial [Streptomyces nigra]
MTEARPTQATSASLWERDEEVAAIGRALDRLCADETSSGSLLVLRAEAGLGRNVRPQDPGADRTHGRPDHRPPPAVPHRAT